MFQKKKKVILLTESQRELDMLTEMLSKCTAQNVNILLTDVLKDVLTDVLTYFRGC